MSVEINWVGVLLATVLSIVIGTIWYGPLYGKQWRSLVGLSQKSEPTPRAMAIAFVSALLMAYVLAYVTYVFHNFFNNSWMEDSITTAVLLWLGFQISRMVMRDAFDRKRKMLTVINAGNDLATALVMGISIGLFKG